MKKKRYGYHSHIEHPLKDEIYKREMSLNKFAELCNISKDTVKSLIARRTKMPYKETIELMSGVLEMPEEKVKELFE